MDDRAKAKQFFAGLADYLQPLIEYLDDNLHASQELTNAETKFSEFQFWLGEAVNAHGIK